MRLYNYCLNVNIEVILMNTENSKTNEPCKFFLNLSQRLDSRSLNKHFALQNLSVCYTWKNIRQQHKNTQNNSSKFELPGGSYSVTDIY